MCFQLNPTRMAEWASRIRVTTQEAAAMQALPIAEPFVIIYIYIFFLFGGCVFWRPGIPLNQETYLKSY